MKLHKLIIPLLILLIYSAFTKNALAQGFVRCELDSSNNTCFTINSCVPPNVPPPTYSCPRNGPCGQRNIPCVTPTPTPRGTATPRPTLPSCGASTCFDCDPVGGCLVNPSGPFTLSECQAQPVAACSGPLPTSTSTGINWSQLYSELNQTGGGNFIFSSTLTIAQIIDALIRYLFPIAGLLMLLLLLYGGFKYLTSGGDPKSIAGARATLTTAIIGFAIVFTSYWIVQIVSTILGLGSTVGNIFQ